MALHVLLALFGLVLMVAVLLWLGRGLKAPEVAPAPIVREEIVVSPIDSGPLDRNQPLATFDPLSPDAAGPGLLVPRDLRPGQICEAMAGTGYPNSGWVRSPLGGAQWECASTSDAAGSAFIGPSLPENSIFYILRGSETRASELRVKVSLARPDDATIWADTAALVAPFVASTGQVVTDAAVTRSAAEAGLQLTSAAVAYSWQKEFSSLPRYNLVLRRLDASGRRLEPSLQAMQWTEWIEPFGPVPAAGPAAINPPR